MTEIQQINRLHADGNQDVDHGSASSPYTGWETPGSSADLSDVRQTEFLVSSVRWNGHLKVLRLEPGPVYLTVPLSACVTTGDKIRYDCGHAWVLCNNGLCQILPLFARHSTLRIGDICIPIFIKEVTEPQEQRAVHSLAEYHYRGARLFGRTAKIIARASHPLFPQVLGYLELATPFYMNKARARILDAPFNVNGIAWEHWDRDSTRQYVHLMVRIARCVVYPEFRGTGLGKMLVRYAAEFAKDRWQMARYLPYFMEISADMLKFVPFAEKAGMTFVGQTEGNLQRVYKDMEYLTRNASRVQAAEIVSQESSGIVDQQVARMDRVLSLVESLGGDLQTILDRLKRLSQEEVLRDFALFHNVVSLPKPSYMQGLNRDAEAFLRRRVNDVKPEKPMPTIQLRVEPLSQAIVLEKITARFLSRVRRTRRTHTIHQAFGISPDAIESVVVRDLSLEVHPGEIILITGPSGSGKTTVLDILAAGPRGWKRGTLDGRIYWPSNYNVGQFEPVRSQKALVELMPWLDVETALYLMGLVGLSDAFIYLKRFAELSRGQQYRATLAKLIANGHNVWLVDEFCANLDPATANLAADKLQYVARKLGATVVAAAPHCDGFAQAFKPDKVVQLTTAWEHHILPGQEFLTALKDAQRISKQVHTLRLRPWLLQAVRLGGKRTTIRTGQRPIGRGPLLFQCQGDSILVDVTNVIHKYYEELTEADAQAEGYRDLAELQRELLRFYPRLRKNSPLTIIQFDIPFGTTLTISQPRTAGSNGRFPNGE